MNYISFLLIVLTFNFLNVYGQPMLVQDDFEGNGNITTWAEDNCSMDINFDNPFKQGINTSSKVLSYHDTGGQYANIRFDVEENFNLVEHHTFSLKIYVPSSGLTGSQPNQVSLKLQDRNLSEPWSTQSEVIKPIALDQWQTVTFNFFSDNYINLNPNSPPPIYRPDFNRVLIQVNGENNSDQVQAYIDDFYYEWQEKSDPVFDYLVWSDEFDNDGAVDPSKWHHQVKPIAGQNWANGEIQHYTNRIENSYIENGVLKIAAKKETYTYQGNTKQYTSARLNSKFAFTYGKVEVRAKLPSGIGTWPAIWMLGKNISENGGYWSTQGFGTTSWPACGEIDIMEHWGNNQNYVQSAIHTPSSFGGTVNYGGQTIPTASSDFHTYTLEWTEGELKFSVDEVLHYVYNPSEKNSATWPFDLEQYLLLNVAILPEIESSFTSSNMEIDYVRVYQESPTSDTKNILDNKLKIFPNPFTDVINVSFEKAIESNVKLELFDLNGNMLKHNVLPKGNEVFKLDGLNELKSGVYFLIIQNGEKYQNLKMVKN